MNASLSSDLFLECNAYKSCYQASIIFGRQSPVITNCLEANACQKTSGCLEKEAGVCYYAILNAEYSNNVNLSYNHIFDCARVTLDVNHRQNATVTSIDNNYDITLFCTGITNSSTMNCNGKYICCK
eukprot:271465_1